jgi:hypothetical protein
MHSDTLSNFRRDLYRCFCRAGDALMNLADALLTETPAHSLPELALSPFFERRWPSLYEALQDAKIDRVALQKLFAQHAPLPEEGERLLLGGDASSILRVWSKTARDRTYVHASNLPEGTKPTRPGWQFSTLVVLPEQNSSWTYVLDNRRIKSEDTQASVMAAQLTEALPLLPARPLFLGDGYYGSAVFLALVENLPCDFLLRLAKNRVLYREPKKEAPRRGHPTWHGERFACHDQKTQGEPDDSWEGEDQGGKRVEVACWHRLHFQKARTALVSVIRVTRHAAKDTQRDPKVSWFVFRGLTDPPLPTVSPRYGRRYSAEHGYRVDKQDLLWETPRLRTPEQFQHWTDLVACVRNQLVLARPRVGALRQAWENPHRPATPQQVRRCMGRIIAWLGTPARPCRPRGYSPGWTPGRLRTPAPTYPVVYKATEKPQKGQKRGRKQSKRLALVT